MKSEIDPYVKSLLEIWGRMQTSEDIGYPKTSPGFKEYTPRGFRDGYIQTDQTEADKLSDFIDNEFNEITTKVLIAKYRKRLPRRRAAKYCKISEKAYSELFWFAIRKIEYNILEKEDELLQSIGLLYGFR